MKRLAIITAFLGELKNRYMNYQPDRSIKEKFAVASKIKDIEGLELCYPADFTDISLLKSLLSEYGFLVPAINVRSRRTGKWLRGSFTSQNPDERQEVVDDFKRAMDLAVQFGSTRISTCPLNDGHDYPFEMNYLDAYQFAQETFSAICEHNPAIKVCIEYKWNDPRTRCLFASAGETLSFCQSVGHENLGITLDIGHALLAGERPAQSVALVARANKLFYVHLNDNDRNWDWDMIPGAFHIMEFVEFFHYLNLVGYTNEWCAYDVFAKEVDIRETFNTVTYLTRKLESLADQIDTQKMSELLVQRNPAKSLRFMYDTLFK